MKIIHSRLSDTKERIGQQLWYLFIQKMELNHSCDFVDLGKKNGHLI